MHARVLNLRVENSKGHVVVSFVCICLALASCDDLPDATKRDQGPGLSHISDPSSVLL